ncbi:hypothetical protein BKA65DRAFT_554200 [Rhexocercosporidium sp. MPI-PUGE-AT-0058]|nr:hypothetical protein BKA65DRAFT_554200 [Rhexocercosporidium sp. MPI-PUGE-AT-0058]
MEQLALFAIPRGYTEEGEADSGNAAPQIDPNASSLGSSNASSTLARELRLCGEIMSDVVEQAHLGYLFELTTIPPFHLWISGPGRIKISPLSIPKIVRKLEIGEYRNSAELLLEMNVFFTLLDFTHESGTREKLRSLFDSLWEDNIGYPYGNNLYSLLKQEIVWKFWSAAQVSRELDSTSPVNVAVAMEMYNGEIISRVFSEATSIEYLYMFADSYELICILPPISIPARPTNYQHKYHFMLNLAGNTTPSGRCRLDSNISIGEVTKISTDFVVLDLGIGEPAQISGLSFELAVEATGKPLIEEAEDHRPLDRDFLTGTKKVPQTFSNQPHTSPDLKQGVTESNNDEMGGREFEDEIAKLKEERDHWKNLALRRNGPGGAHQGSIAYEYNPPAPESEDVKKVGTLVIIVLQARDLHAQGNDFFDVRLGNGGNNKFARSSSVRGSGAEWNKDFSFDVHSFEVPYNLGIAVGQGALVGTALVNLRDLIVPSGGQRAGMFGRRGWYNLDFHREIAGAIQLDVRFYPSTPTASTSANSSKPTHKDPAEE